MSTIQQSRNRFPDTLQRAIWQGFFSPGLVLWLIALAALGFLCMGLIPQVPVEIQRDPALKDLWLKGTGAPWSGAINTLHTIGLTTLVNSRVFYIYCALLMIMMVAHLVRIVLPRWSMPAGILPGELWPLSYSVPESLTYLERGMALVNLRLLHRRPTYASAGDTLYIQGISKGIRNWGSALLVLGMIILLATGIYMNRHDVPHQVLEVSPGETIPLLATADSSIQLVRLSAIANHSASPVLNSFWKYTTHGQTRDLTLTLGHPAHLGNIGFYLLDYGPSVYLSATDSNGVLINLQRISGEPLPQLALSLRFDNDQHEQLVALKDFGVLLRLVHYPSLPAQGINGRALHVQILQAETGALLQEAYLDRNSSISTSGITVNFTLDYYARLRTQSEPWRWLLFLGGVLVITGFLCALFMPRRELWLTVTPASSGTWCQIWAAPGDIQAKWMQPLKAIMHEVSDAQR